jgi:hypothetical protein
VCSVSVWSHYQRKVEFIDCWTGKRGSHPTRVTADTHPVVDVKRANGQNKLLWRHNEQLEGEARSAASCMTAIGCVQEV